MRARGLEEEAGEAGVGDAEELQEVVGPEVRLEDRVKRERRQADRHEDDGRGPAR